MSQEGHHSSNNKRMNIARKFFWICMSLAAVTLLVVFVAVQFEETGVSVSGQVGVGQWPLVNIEHGTVICQHREAKQYVFFKAPSGRLYGLNGTARAAASAGAIDAGDAYYDIMVEERLVPAVSGVVSSWRRAGLALCEGDKMKAQKLVDEANRLAVQPMDADVDRVLSMDPAEVRRREIYLEIIHCDKQAMQKARGADTRLDLDLLNRVKVECFAVIQEREDMTAEDIFDLGVEGSLRLWPQE